MDTRSLIETFLRHLYRRAEGAGHEERFSLHQIADELHVSHGLIIKLSKHLEAQGFVDFESGAVDITVPGMLHVEERESAGG